ncbi:MAG: hypothetical protein CMJ18_04280, partial [Phycisphaeraceae bacterium]|nr:hypothetical protein [Phycisphaeraceae bacterium]
MGQQPENDAARDQAITGAPTPETGLDSADPAPPPAMTDAPDHAEPGTPSGPDPEAALEQVDKLVDDAIEQLEGCLESDGLSSSTFQTVEEVLAGVAPAETEAPEPSEPPRSEAAPTATPPTDQAAADPDPSDPEDDALGAFESIDEILADQDDSPPAPAPAPEAAPADPKPAAADIAADLEPDEAAEVDEEIQGAFETVEQLLGSEHEAPCETEAPQPAAASEPVSPASAESEPAEAPDDDALAGDFETVEDLLDDDAPSAAPEPVIDEPPITSAEKESPPPVEAEAPSDEDMDGAFESVDDVLEPEVESQPRMPTPEEEAARIAELDEMLADGANNAVGGEFDTPEDVMAEEPPATEPEPVAALANESEPDPSAEPAPATDALESETAPETEPEPIAEVDESVEASKPEGETTQTEAADETDSGEADQNLDAPGTDPDIEAKEAADAPEAEKTPPTLDQITAPPVATADEPEDP